MEGRRIRFFAAVLLHAILVATKPARGQNEELVNSRVQGVSLYQGDILLTREQQSTLEDTSNPDDPYGPQRAVVRRTRSVWLDGRVPYVIDSLDATAVEVIHEAIAEYTEKTCIRFVPRTNQADYVRFYRGTGCYSFIGRIGGPQEISVGYGCAYKGVLLHEMFHALGRWHEQSRPDRDLYIRIVEDNIQSGLESNFQSVSRAFVTTQGVPYDLSSIMHYGAYAFSRNGQPTIKPRNPSIPLSTLGQRGGLSRKDFMHINALYCEDMESSTATWTPWSSWSSCSRTCNGGTRTRTRSCSGGSSCEGSNFDSDRCNTDPCPVPPTWGQWTSWSGCSTTCGSGRQSRVRRCLNGNSCVGKSTEFRDCNRGSCPQPATWSAWSSWSSCSKTCEGGTRTKQRTCVHGNDCPGSDHVVESCNADTPCQPTLKPTPIATPTAVPSQGEWSEWTQCTKECGGGTRMRTRMCILRECEEEREECNTQDCNPQPLLIGLYHVDCYYVPRYSTSLGLLEGLTDDLMDDPLTRTDPVQRCAKAAIALGYSMFAVSIGYCISGSSSAVHYRYVRSSICNNGVGGYQRGYFGMDVYQIGETEQVQDVVLQIDSRAASEPFSSMLHPPIDGASNVPPAIHSLAVAMQPPESPDVNTPLSTTQRLSDDDYANSGNTLSLSCFTIAFLIVISLCLHVY